MRRIEINRLLAVLYGILLLSSAYVAYRVTDNINPLLFFGFWVLLEQFFVIPSVAKHYMEIQKVPGTHARFVPIYNEWLFFSSKIAKTTLWSCGVFVVLGVFSLATWAGYPLVEQAIYFIFGGKTLYQASVYLILLTVLSYIVLVWVEGLGYSIIWRYISREYPVDYGVAVMQRAWDKIQYLVLFIPFIRVISLFSISSRLKKINEYMSTEEDIKEGFNKIK